MIDTAAARHRLGRLRRAARRRLRRAPDPALAHAAALARALAGDRPPDVVQLADSTATWASPDDRDTRSLPEMVDDLLPGGTLMVLADGGFHLGLFSRYLALVALAPHRPQAVVVSLCLRLSTDTWLHHPRYGHANALRLLDLEIERGGSFVALAARLPRTTPRQWADFRSRSHRTAFGPRLTIGEHLDALAHPSMPTIERSRLLHHYHNGAYLDAGDDGVRLATEVGRQCAALGLPVVAYQNPANVETLAEHWGQEARTSVERGFALLSEAFLTGARDVTPDPIRIRMLETGTAFPAKEFIDPDDATEHLNESGRLHLAGDIADALRDLLRS